MNTNYVVNLWESTENTTITVQEGDDGMIEVKANTNYFGDIDFTMDLECAEVFANGILKQVEFIRVNK